MNAPTPPLASFSNLPLGPPIDLPAAVAAGTPGLIFSVPPFFPGNSYAFGPGRIGQILVYVWYASAIPLSAGRGGFHSSAGLSQSAPPLGPLGSTSRAVQNMIAGWLLIADSGVSNGSTGFTIPPDAVGVSVPGAGLPLLACVTSPGPSSQTRVSLVSA
jgi:hypothetical protein